MAVVQCFCLIIITSCSERLTGVEFICIQRVDSTNSFLSVCIILSSPGGLSTLEKFFSAVAGTVSPELHPTGHCIKGLAVPRDTIDIMPWLHQGLYLFSTLHCAVWKLHPLGPKHIGHRSPRALLGDT